MRCVTALAVHGSALSWSVSRYFVAIHPWTVHHVQQKISKNTKTQYFGGSMSFKVTDVNTAKKLISTHQCMLWEAACLCIFAIVFTLDEPILVKRHFLKGYPLTLACADLLEPRGSGLGLLKSMFESMFDAENFICMFFWSISSHFVTIHLKQVRCSQKLWKIHQKPLFWRFTIVQGHWCW